jgi:hypothetical protein
MARAVQITQWTFLARPGHPVFLDALGRTLRQAEEVQLRSKQASENGEVYTSPSAVSWAFLFLACSLEADDSSSGPDLGYCTFAMGI